MKSASKILMELYKGKLKSEGWEKVSSKLIIRKLPNGEVAQIMVRKNHFIFMLQKLKIPVASTDILVLTYVAYLHTLLATEMVSDEKLDFEAKTFICDPYHKVVVRYKNGKLSFHGLCDDTMAAIRKLAGYGEPECHKLKRLIYKLIGCKDPDELYKVINDLTDRLPFSLFLVDYFYTPFNCHSYRQRLFNYRCLCKLLVSGELKALLRKLLYSILPKKVCREALKKDIAISEALSSFESRISTRWTYKILSLHPNLYNYGYDDAVPAVIFIDKVPYLSLLYPYPVPPWWNEPSWFIDFYWPRRILHWLINPPWRSDIHRERYTSLPILIKERSSFCPPELSQYGITVTVRGNGSKRYKYCVCYAIPFAKREGGKWVWDGKMVVKHAKSAIGGDYSDIVAKAKAIFRKVSKGG